MVMEDRTRNVHLVRPSGATPSPGEAFPHYSRPVLLGLRAIRKTVGEASALPREERQELANALRLTAIYLDLQLQIDAIEE